MKTSLDYLIAAFVATALVVFGSNALASPITNWSIDDFTTAHFSYVNFSGLTTDSPVVGDGTDQNADYGAINASFPTVSLLDGQSLILSGSMTISGAKTTGERTGLFFGILYEPGTVGNPVDHNGWLGYAADSSNDNGGVVSGDEGSGRIFARDVDGTDFNTTTWLSVGAGRGVEVANDPQADTFADGTYDLMFKVTRNGSNAVVSASIVGTGGTTYSDVLGPATVSDPTQLTLDFNRVGLWATDLDAEQVTYSGMDLSLVPEPTTVVLLGLGLLTLIGARRNRR